MQIRLLNVVTAALLFWPIAAQSQATSPSDRPLPISRATRTTDAPRVDGRLDEAAWQSAPVTDVFTQIDPDEGRPASQRTDVRVLFDDQYLYVGVRLHDSGRVIGRLGRRDMDAGDSDWFGVVLDSYHDHRTAFGFTVNPLGVRRDEVRIITDADRTWDPVWDVATVVDSTGWTAEFRIPFSQLRFSGNDQQTWGVQFERVIGRRHETATSTFMPKSEVGGVPKFGHLEGLQQLKAGKRVELLPYVVQRASFVDPGANPFKSNPDYGTTGGLDAVLRVSSNLTLNAAINPDFGQVEVDPAVVNLGVYETFFEEKRPLFIEGSDIFGFGANSTSGGQLFYSRRIGRVPSLRAPSAASDLPDATTILGSGKLSGKIGDWSIGVLEAVTARETSRYLTQANTEDEFVVEPLSNYLVARARREARGGQTFVGGIVTAVNRDLSTPQLESALHRSAYSAGIDFRHEWANRQWLTYGDVEVSRVAGSRAAITATQRRSNHYFQRPDASHLDVDSSATSLTGYSLNLAVGRQAGRHWRGNVGGALTSPTYEVNDLGFAVRTDRQDLRGHVAYVENTPGRVLRSWSASLFGRSEHNYDWQPIQTFVGVAAGGTSAKYWSYSLTATRHFRAIDDRLTRGGPLARRPARVEFQASTVSDVRKPVTLHLFALYGEDETGASGWSISPQIGVKTSSRWNLSVGPTLSKGESQAQYVTTAPNASNTSTFGRDYVFAPFRQTSLSLETRFNATFSPRLSLETYVQPLLSSQDYGSARRLVAPETYEFAPYAGQVPNLDFNLRSLRGNAVLRWEWRQGSTVYVAWQQSRADVAPFGDFEFSRDRRALFGTRPDNIFVVKMSYWLNP